MISKILIAIDGSPHSTKAVEVGSEIAAGLGAKVLLFHVVRLESIPKAMKQFAEAELLGGTDVDILMRAGEHLLTDEADRARSAGVTSVEIEVDKGPVARTIIATAKRREIDLVVLGSRGLGDVEGLLRGGVSHRVETLAKCPVLVVK